MSLISLPGTGIPRLCRFLVDNDIEVDNAWMTWDDGAFCGILDSAFLGFGAKPAQQSQGFTSSLVSVLYN